MELVNWGIERLPDLQLLWNRTCPDEKLTTTELATVLTDDGAVLATADGLAVIAFVQGSDDARHRGNVRLLVAAPEVQGRGLGHALLAAAQDRLAARGVSSIRLAGGVPRYLWPGIDTENTAARALARSHGYEVVDTAVNMAITTAYRASTPAGIEVRRVVDGDVDDLQALIDAHWPLLLTEMQIAHARGSLWTARAGGRLVGFSAHSTMRTGWIGPMGTAPDHRGRGVGAALLSAACEDLQQRGIPAADIAWVGPVEYFAAKGARVTRTFERYVRELR